VAYAQDPVGNVTGAVSVAGTVRYAFDAAERLSGIQTDHADFAATYNPWNGLLAQTTNSSTGIFVEYAYSDMDELTNIVWRASDGSVLRSFAYGYNAASMITNIALETGARIVYSYDDLDRLTAETRTGEPGTAYEYDLAGNRMRTIVDGTTNTYSLGLGNRLASWTSGSYSHDAAGCVTNIVRAGRPELDLAWNGLYQVESVATNGVLAESYGYGPLGRRLYTAQNGVTNWHVYDGIHVVADVDDTGSVLRSYTWGAGIDNLLAFTDHTGGATNTYFALTDHLGTVHALADENGVVVESYKFDAWGNVLGVFDSNGSPLSESALGNRYLFQGREYSWATGLYYFRARWYDPVTGRWLSKDPIGISGGLNQFVAFGNNPVNMRDPFGLELFPGGGDWPAGTITGVRFGSVREIPSALGEMAVDVWNLPNTLIGVGFGGVGLFAGGHPPYRDNGAIVFPENPAVAWIPMSVSAIVLGATIHYAPGWYPDSLIDWRYDGLPTTGFLLGDHEVHHLPQYRRWGPFFIPAYFAAEFIFRVNPFEVSADNAAERAYLERLRRGRLRRGTCD
jgi:RHS repeat-associated protein